MEKRIVTIIVGMFLVVGLVMGYQHTQSRKTGSVVTPTPSVSVASTVEPRITSQPAEVAVLKKAVEQAAKEFARERGINGESVLIENIWMTQNWARGTIVLPITKVYEWFAQKQDNNWIVAIESTQAFRDWTLLIPISLVPQDEKERLLKTNWQPTKQP